MRVQCALCCVQDAGCCLPARDFILMKMPTKGGVAKRGKRTSGIKQ